MKIDRCSRYYLHTKRVQPPRRPLCLQPKLLSGLRRKEFYKIALDFMGNSQQYRLKLLSDRNVLDVNNEETWTLEWSKFPPAFSSIVQFNCARASGNISVAFFHSFTCGFIHHGRRQKKSHCHIRSWAIQLTCFSRLQEASGIESSKIMEVGLLLWCIYCY